ncbi:MAG: flagellar hook-length control protein FliK [Xanthomonadaceae bacterium]|nr:flagellar hook-length control protein FliK [Xanthomonadaceae bacterium]
MTIVATLVPSAPSATAAGTAVHAAATADSHAATDTPGHFDQQFQLARQQRMSTTDSGDASKAASHQAGDPRQQRDPSPPVTDLPTTAAVQAAVATPKAAGSGDRASDHNGDHGGDPAATAMAGAMLALLGPSAAVAPRPGAVAASAAPGIAVSANGGKGVAADADAGTAAAGLQQVTDAGSDAAAAGNALPQNASVAPAVQTPASTKAGPASDSASAVAQAIALPAPPAGGAPAGMPQLQLSAPVGSPAFAQELGQHVAWLGGQDVAQARIRLHPAELGQLDVKINVTHGRVDVVFSAQHPAAVNAVQQSLPQLGHMLAQHGLALDHAEVGQHDRGEHRSHSGNAPAAAVMGEPDEVGGINLSVSPGSVSLLDAFA